MASLRSLLGSKQDAFVSVTEENLEKGRIYVYTPGTNYSNIWCGFCFHPDTSGTAVVEVWGADVVLEHLEMQVLMFVKQFLWLQAISFVDTLDYLVVMQLHYVSEVVQNQLVLDFA